MPQNKNHARMINSSSSSRIAGQVFRNGFKVLVGNHARQRALVERLMKAEPAERPSLAKQLSREVALHYTMHFRVVYPQMQGTLDDGNAILYQTLFRHRGIVELASGLEHLSGRAEEEEYFRQTIRRLHSEMSKNHQVEQGDIYRRMQELLTDEDLEKLQQALELTEEIAPRAASEVPKYY